MEAISQRSYDLLPAKECVVLRPPGVDLFVVVPVHQQVTDTVAVAAAAAAAAVGALPSSSS